MNGTALLLDCHLKILENRAVLKKVIKQFLTGLFGLLVVEHPGVIFQNVMVHGKRYTPVSVNGLKTAPLIIFFVF